MGQSPFNPHNTLSPPCAMNQFGMMPQPHASWQWPNGFGNSAQFPPAPPYPHPHPHPQPFVPAQQAPEPLATNNATAETDAQATTQIQIGRAHVGTPVTNAHIVC